jgi:hypothetical protein
MSYKLLAFLAVIATPLTSSIAQEARKLSVVEIDSVKEIDPATVQIDLILDDGSHAIIQTDVFAARGLAAQIEQLGR